MLLKLMMSEPRIGVWKIKFKTIGTILGIQLFWMQSNLVEGGYFCCVCITDFMTLRLPISVQNTIALGN